MTRWRQASDYDALTKERDALLAERDGLIEITHTFAAKLRIAEDREQMVLEALKTLVQLKDDKDRFGKTYPYRVSMPLAWAEARRAVDLAGRPRK